MNEPSIVDDEINWKGPVFRIFNGEGTLSGSSFVNESIDCRFTIVQYENADIRVYAQLEVSPQGREVIAFDRWRNSGNDNFELRGTLDDGRGIVCRGLMFTSSNMSLKDDEFSVTVSGHVREVTINSNSKAENCLVKSFLTNFEVPIHFSSLELEGRSLQVDSRVFRIEPLVSDENTFRRLESLRQTRVTAVVVTEIENIKDLDLIQEIIHKLCRVLTLLQGTMVSPIGHEVTFLNPPRGSEPASAAFYLNAVTRPFGGKSILNNLVAEKYELSATWSQYRHWIEGMYPTLERANRDFGLVPVLHSYLDACNSSDFLELRALKICCCMEILREKYLGLTNSKYILDPEEWEEALPLVQADFREILSKHLPNLDQGSRDAMARQLQGLNHSTFRGAIKGLCRQVDFKSRGNRKETEEIFTAFLAIRNNIVHKGGFPVEGSLDTAEEKLEYRNARYSQYQFLERFCGGVLGQMLGWNDYQTSDETLVFMPAAPKVWEA